MKIISWNVNGLRAVHKKGVFLKLLEEQNPDVICLQEIKSKKDQNEIDLKEYKEFWNPAERAGYSGTAIFTKQTPLSVAHGFPSHITEKYSLKDKYGDTNTEGRVLTAELEEFFVVTVYTPNSKADLTRLRLREKYWDPAFLEYVNSLKKIKPVIFCGDLNVAHTPDDLAKPKQNEGNHGYTEEERKGIDNMLSSGFVDIFRKFKQGNGHYTWWNYFGGARDRNVGWRIDYFFVDEVLVPKVKTSEILSSVLGSDHCPILLEIKK